MVEQVGVYKFDLKLYCMVFEQFGVDVVDVVFVVGFSYDMFGIVVVGLCMYWYNCVGLMLVEGVQLLEIIFFMFDDLLFWACCFVV